MNICILLTASINPPNTAGLGRSAVADRENDYIKSLRFYKGFGLPIVFCDNSGYKSETISSYCQEHSQQIEFLPFISQESIHGKSHGEMEIFDFAHKNSKFIASSTHVIKVTGRLIVENFQELLNQTSNNDAWIYANIKKGLTYADSRLFVYKKEYYPDFLQPVLADQLNDAKRFYFERCLARSIHLFMAQSDEFELLPVYPYFDGYNGTTNRSYKLSVFDKWKFSIYYKIKKFIYKYTI